MNVLFLAENPQLYIEYAVRLERNDVPFWKASNNNDFHKMMTQIKIDVVFADYHFMNFKEFDVYQHVSKHRKDMVFLFLNDPEGVGDLMVQWEDRVRHCFPDQWSDELNTLLRIMAMPSEKDIFSCRPARLQDLMEPLEDNGGSVQPVPPQRLVVEKTDRGVMGTGDVAVLQGEVRDDPSGVVAFEDGSLEEFMNLRKKYQIGYQEYILMKLFFHHLNQLVEMKEILKTLGLTSDKKNVNAVYHYIYRVRSFLRKLGQPGIQLLRIKKGCYSLVSDERNRRGIALDEFPYIG